MRTRLRGAFRALVATLILAGCSVPPASSVPATPTPAPSASSTAATASPSPVVTTPTPGATLPLATVVESQLLVRFTTFPDVYVAPVPADLSVFADGTLLQAAWQVPGFEDARFVVRRLAPSGVAVLVADTSSAIPRSGEVGAVPAGWDSGFVSYVASVWRGGALVTARTTNASRGAGVSELVDLVDRWRDPMAMLPADAWTDPEPQPYVAARWFVGMQVSPGAAAPDAPDGAEVVALIGDPTAFGEPVDQSGLVSRCAIVDRPMRDLLAAALAATDIDLRGGLGDVRAELRAGEDGISLALIPLPPGGSTSCRAVIGD